jgi:hypothetical protein
MQSFPLLDSRAKSRLLIRTSKPWYFADATLGLRFPGRQCFGDAEGHLDSTRTIAHICFDVTIHAEPDSPAAKLNSGTRPTVRSLESGTAKPLISWGQLLNRIAIGGVPQIVKSSDQLHLLATELFRSAARLIRWEKWMTISAESENSGSCGIP